MRVNPFPFKHSARVEMVPLIDMFFLLLVFFIFSVFAMTVQEGIIVDLPTAATAGSLKPQSPVILSLTKEGRLFLNQEPVTLEALTAGLRAQAVQSPQMRVTINADAQVSHGRVVSVLDAVRQAGLQRVSFQTLPKSTSQNLPRPALGLAARPARREDRRVPQPAVRKRRATPQDDADRPSAGYARFGHVL